MTGRPKITHAEARAKPVEQHRSAVGWHRKQIERALAAEVEAWLDGRPGDLCMGDLYQRFFRSPADTGRGA